MSGLWGCVLKNCETFITNEVVTSRHDCGLERYTYDLDSPKRLANCKLYKQYYSTYCLVPKNLISYLEILSAF